MALERDGVGACGSGCRRPMIAGTPRRRSTPARSRPSRRPDQPGRPQPALRRDCSRGGSRLIRGCKRAFASGPGCHERDPDQGRSARRGVSRQCGGDGRFGPGPVLKSEKSSRAAGRPGASGISGEASFCRGSVVRALLDPGAPFLELSALAAFEVYDEDVPAGHHHRYRARRQARNDRVANDADREGRQLLSDHGEEASARAAGRAARTRLPCIYLVDSGGVATCRGRTRCSRTASTSDASSTTRRRCPRATSRRSRS